MYCHIFHVRTIPTLESIDSMITMYHPSSSVFMTNKTLEARKSITKVPNQKVPKQIAFLLLSSHGLAQYCVNL